MNFCCIKELTLILLSMKANKILGCLKMNTINSLLCLIEIDNFFDYFFKNLNKIELS